jgi:hypothetical protein
VGREGVGVGVELVEEEAVRVVRHRRDVEAQASRLVANRRLGVRRHAGEELLTMPRPHLHLDHQAEHCRPPMP